MLDEIRSLAKRGVSFGFETTPSGRSYVPLLRQLKAQGYEIHMFFLWLKNVDLAISRVRDRVLRGGHDIPEPVIRRRFDRSIQNFLMYYRQVADEWMLFDNSGEAPSVIALEESGSLRIIKKTTYATLVEHYSKI